MKKQYIQPTTKIHALRPSRMCAGSTEVNLDSTPYTGDDSGVGSKEDGDFGW